MTSKPILPPAIMCLGVSSNAGKSILTAALCRIFTQDGLRVLPFKGQNMTSAICKMPNGLLASHTQLVHATACRQQADPRMNPVLLRPLPEGGGSEVIILGKNTGPMGIAAYIEYKAKLSLLAKEAYNSLAMDADIMVLEGAGSPAEINLKTHDFVNMGMCLHAKARALLVGDIDRGGVFAHFVGTLSLLPQEEQNQIAGFVINKFRGDASLLGTALCAISTLTGKDFFGVIPYLPALGLPEEDSLSAQETALQKKDTQQEETDMDTALDRLAAHVREHLDIPAIYRQIEMQKSNVHRQTRDV